jgi:hypothetical protein
MNSAWNLPPAIGDMAERNAREGKQKQYGNTRA